MVSMMGVLLFLGIFWLVFAAIEKNNKILFILAVWCFSYALFFFGRIDHLSPFRPSAYLLIRAENIALFICSSLFPLFLDIYQKRISLFTKIFSSIYIFFALLAVFVPLSFLSELGSIWIRLIPLYFIYILFRFFQYLLIQPRPKTLHFITSGTGIVLLTFLFHGVFVTWDVLFNTQSNLSDLFSRYSVVLSTLTLSVVLMIEFVQGYVKTRGLRDQLEQAINVQTKELREAKEYVESIFENSAEGIAVFDLGIRLVRCNQAYLDLFGYTFNEYMQLSITDLFDKSGSEHILNARKEALKTGVLSLIITAYNKAGEKRQISLTGNRTKARTGEEYFIINAYDMTDRMKIEQRLLESKEELYKSKEQYRALVEGTEDLILSLNFDGVITYVNHQVLIHYEKDADQFIGKNMSDIIDTVGNLSLKNTLDAVLATGQMLRIKTEVQFPKFVSSFEFTLNPQMGGDGKINSILCIGHNIDEQQSYEKHLVQLIERLNEQQRVLKKTSERILNAQENERSRISRELHDEVGQTLTAVDLNLQLIKQSSKNLPAINSIITECQQIVQNAMEEIHRFSQDLRPIILDDMNLFPAIASYIRSFEARTDISVNFESPDNLGLIPNNLRTLIYRVFQEALTNASKHSKADVVSITLAQSNGLISLVFSDNGIGFKKHMLEGKKNRFGIQGIIERVHLAGGDLSLSSSTTGGAELNIEIPLKRQ